VLLNKEADRIFYAFTSNSQWGWEWIV